MVKKKTTEEFTKEIYLKYPNEFEIIGEYKTAKTPVEVRHYKCNTVFTVTPTNLLTRGRCSNCGTEERQKNSGLTRRRSQEDVKKRVLEETQNTYELIGEYKGSKVKTEFLHKECNNVYLATPHNFFINKTRCPKCSRLEGARKTLEVKTINGTLLKMNTETFKQALSLIDDEILVIGEYRGQSRTIEVKHKKCGYVWSPFSANLLNKGSGCPQCRQAGETENKLYSLLIERFGEESVIRQKKFSNLKGLGGGHLSYDFLVNNTVLIEYNGEQHYHEGRFNGGKEEFEKQIIHDKLKEEYARKNNYSLLVIPYWEKENIEKIVERLVI